MNTLIQTKSLEFRPSGELSQDHWWSGTGKAGRDGSDANQITLPYNMVMEIENLLRDLDSDADIIRSRRDFSFLSLKRSVTDLGSKEQSDFAKKILDAVIRAIPTNRISSFPVDSFQSFLNTDDHSITIELNIPNIYFCVDVEEKVINSSWTLSTSENAGRISEGGFFFGSERIEPIVNSCIRKILEWI